MRNYTMNLSVRRGAARAPLRFTCSRKLADAEVHGVDFDIVDARSTV
jgi:hypothetical protein